MHFKKEIALKLAAAAGIEYQTAFNLLAIPPQSTLGDFAFPCFPLAKELRKAPAVIAQDLAQKISPDEIVKSVQVAGGYLNFFLNQSMFIKTVLEEIKTSNGHFGASTDGNGQKIVVEFSSPNIAKDFHVGHFLVTVVGNSVEKIYRYLGYETVRLNHIGDWGTQFGKFISGYHRFVDIKALEQSPIKELTRVYVKFHEAADSDPSLIEEARNNFKKLEDGDKETTELWKKFSDLSLREFKKIYDLLGIGFDSYNGESFYTDKMDEVVQILKDKSLLKESQGAQVVELDHLNIPPCLVIKSDGTTIYATRDLAAAIYRKRTYNFDKCIYVVGNTQALHFRQLFEVLRLAGFEWANNCVHAGTSLVRMPGNENMSTRKGTVILLEDILDEALSKTRAIIAEKNPSLADLEVVAKQVGLGAVIYAFLKNSRKTDVIFSWEDVLNFEGESGPYVQYTCVRGKSILRKAGAVLENIDYSKLNSEDEFALVKLLSVFPEIIKEAAALYEPSMISRQITTIAQAFNKFYNTHNILNAEEGVKTARLHLVSAVCEVIETGLQLLGIQMPESM